MVRQQRVSKAHEDRYPLCNSSEQRGKDEMVKNDMLDPPRYLRRSEDVRGKALSFGVLDWTQFEKWKDTNSEGSKGAYCSYASSYADSAETAASSLELDLTTGVVKRLELSLKPQVTNMRNESFSLRSQEYSDAVGADTTLRMDHKSRKQKEHQASSSKYPVVNGQSNASEVSPCISPPCPLIYSRQTKPESETSSKILSEAFRTNDVQQGQCSSPVNVVERNRNSIEKPCLLDQNISILTSNKERQASPNRRFSFSFSQMSRSLSSKESSSSVPALSSTSAKSGPLIFNNSNHSTRTKQNGHTRTRSVQSAPTVEKNQCSTRVRALLQFTLRKGINLFQFVVDDKNRNNVLAATMKSSDSSTRSYTLYSVKEVTKKTDSWLSRHRNEEKKNPFAHTVIGEMKTVTSFSSDLTTLKSESVLFGVETSEEVAAIVQTRNKSQRQSTTSIILPSGIHTLPKDGNAPLPLIERWKSGGTCDCGGWDIGCKLRVFSNDHIKSESFLSFQLFGQEREEPVFKMVTHDNELHSVEFGSSISLLEAFFISLAVRSHQSWCEEEEEAVVIGEGVLKRETSSKFASNPPVSPIGRV